MHRNRIWPLAVGLLALGGVLLIACDGYTKHYEHGGECPNKLVDKGAADAGIHEPFDRLLRSFVQKGVVDYRCLAKHVAILDGYLATLAKTDPAKLGDRPRLAYWINAYNAFTLKLILDHYPKVESIKEIPNRWKREIWNAGGKKISLDAIEHAILRKKFAEPRIHFAIVCASFSCPDLAPEAYVAPRLEKQLAAAARGFVRNPKKGALTKMDGDRPTLVLSKLFSWFSGDFEKASGSVLGYVRPLLSDADRAFVTKHARDLKITYLDYDWGLNGP